MMLHVFVLGMCAVFGKTFLEMMFWNESLKIEEYNIRGMRQDGCCGELVIQ